MEYTAAPFGDIWKDGIFNVPNQIIDRYIKLTSEYQLKALLCIFRNGGQATASQLAEVLSLDEETIVDIMEFWCDEGVIAVNGELGSAAPIIEKPVEEKPRKDTGKPSPPRLTREDILNQLRSSKLLGQLVNQAQMVLCRPLSDGELEVVINMVNYYGLPAEVILMILEYYRTESQKGCKLGFSYIDTMARNWCEEGIETVEEADAKLRKIEQSNKRWNEVIAIAGIKRKRPTDKQRDLVGSWFETFDVSMINLAADIMKKAEDVTPNIQYMDKILQRWKRLDIRTVEQAIEYQSSTEKKSSKSDDRIKRDASYDMDEIRRRAMENTDIV